MTNLRPVKWAGGIAMVAAVLLASQTMADTFEWTDPVNGDYTLPGNWTLLSGAGPAPPGVGDTARFNEAGTYRVDFPFGIPHSSDLLDFQAGNVFFNGQLEPQTYNLLTGQADVTLSGGTLTLGESNDAGVPDQSVIMKIGDLLHISGGAALNVLNESIVVTNTLQLDGGDITQDAVSAVVVTDNNLSTSNGFHVGVLDGSGVVTISNGGTVSSTTAIIGEFSNSSSGTVTVTGIGSMWNASSTLVVAGAGTGVLDVLGGGTFENSAAVIGDSAGSMGTVTVDGENSNWTSNSLVIVGEEGEGVVNINNGGNVHNTGQVLIANETGGDGTVNIDGMDSQWISDSFVIVGSKDRGELNITSGGKMQSTSGSIAFDSTSTNDIGIVLVSGTDSRWDTGVLHIGGFGDGTLDITQAGQVNATNVTVGNFADGEGFLQILTGSMLTATGSLTVGGEGDGMLTLQNGILNTAGTSIGVGTGSTGSMFIEPGSTGQWNDTGDVTIGGNGTSDLGTGQLRLRAPLICGGPCPDGANVTIDGSLVVQANGFVLMEYSNLQVTTVDLAAGGAGAFNLSGGTLHAQNIFNLLGQNPFSMTGGTLHVDNYNGNLNQQGGTVSPGASAGITAILGSYTMSAGSTLEIELAGGGGVPGTDFDQVNVTDFPSIFTGIASLDGTLDVSLINAFTPSPGDTFTILTATGGVTGTFDTINAPTFDGIYTLDAIYNANSVVLEVIAQLLAGDANKDGQVTGADLISVQQNFGNVGPVPLQGDANNDGQVTGADLISVQQNFGNVLGPASSVVPEPGTMGLMLIMLCAVSLRSSRAHAKG